MKNTHGVLLLLVKLQAEACNFTKSNSPPWVFFTFFKLYKWYQITQRITNNGWIRLRIRVVFKQVYLNPLMPGGNKKNLQV